MSVPGARVVRGGASARGQETAAKVVPEGRGQETAAEVVPEGRVLRLAPRALPRALLVRLLFEDVQIGWWFAVMGVVAGFEPLSMFKPGWYAMSGQLIIGFLLVFVRLPGALRDLRLLRYGVETTGKLIDKRPLDPQNKHAATMVLTFEYEVDGNTCTATVKTENTDPLEDDERERMLYDLRSPSRATTLDHLPGSPKIGPTGELEAQARPALHLLILPVLFAVLLAAYVVTRAS